MDISPQCLMYFWLAHLVGLVSSGFASELQLQTRQRDSSALPGSLHKQTLGKASVQGSRELILHSVLVWAHWPVVLSLTSWLMTNTYLTELLWFHSFQDVVPNTLGYKFGTITSWPQVWYSQYPKGARKRNSHSVGLTIPDQLRNCKWHISQRQKWVLFMKPNWVMFFHFCCVFIFHILCCSNSNVKSFLITLKVPPGNLQ